MAVSLKYRLLTILLFALLCCGSLLAAEVEQFADGDRVCFVGDSITHGGSYHTVIALFYATRFPDRNIRMYNCGVSGDTAEGTIRRFGWDIEPKKPTVATVMLGMNDVGRDTYKLGERTESEIALGKWSLGKYANNMDTLCSMLVDEEASLILIKPSIYDQTAELDRTNNFGVNDALGICGDYCDELSEKHHTGIVDFYSALLEINKIEQAKDPSFTIIGPDRIHPKSTGHFVMAYTFLKAQNIGRYVSKTVIDAKEGCVKEVINCKVSSLKVGKDSVSYECIEGALPFPAEAIDESAQRFVDFKEDMNKQVVEVVGLEPGDYELLIDEMVVGEFTSNELSGGVDISANVSTPQYKQAMEVSELNKQRAAASYAIRGLAHVEHNMLKESVYYPQEFENAKIKLAEVVERTKGKSWYNYYVSQEKRYAENKPRQNELAAEVEKCIDKIYEVNKPVAHKYELRKATD